MKKTLIYGIGHNAKYLIDMSLLPDEAIIGFVQSNKTVDEWEGHTVFSLSQIKDISFDEIWIANCYIETLENCIQAGVPKEKIVICNMIVCDMYCKKNGILDIRYLKTEAEMYENYVHSRCKKLMTNSLDRYHVTPYMKYNGELLFHHDYFRYAVLGLLAEEIRKNNVRGELAELGVFRGSFSKCINGYFPERTLYLFDTFEGFPEGDVIIEEKGNYTPGSHWQGAFKDTSENYVLQQMPHPEKCIIRKGYFPATIPSKEVSYALVSLDCDLYQPTLEGLRYFYPRLSKGGYMMIHDYNHEDRWLGVKQAVKEYEDEYGRLIKTPIADVAGSLVIGK